MTSQTRSPSLASKSVRADADGATAPVDRATLLKGLNHDLAGEYQAILMYTHYAAKLTGPFRNELRALFQAEVADEQKHAQFLADKIAVLGGEPTTEPRGWRTRTNRARCCSAPSRRRSKRSSITMSASTAGGGIWRCRPPGRSRKPGRG